MAQTKKAPTRNRKAGGKKSAKKEALIRNAFAQLQNSTSLIRSSLLTKLFDDRRDLDVECGYPKDITMEQYNTLYQREGIARRVVGLLPEDSWSEDPEVYETEDQKNVTEFEKVWGELEDKFNLYHYLHRIDELSGIGRFGVLLLGLDDGGELDEPAPGINERGEMVDGEQELNLIYLRPFSENNVTIKTRETDTQNPRYGQPLLYTITFQENIGPLSSSEMQAVTGDKSASALKTTAKVVHWSRVIHVADNRKTSEVYGTPRMEPVYNRIYDIRKILSSSGEMFYKGAFPGYSFEMTPEAIADGATLDSDSLEEQFTEFANGLQRYLAVEGLSAKSLAPQVADPKAHIETQLRAIAISLSVPYRIFLGTEEAKLASVQDVQTWNKRVNKRQDKYLTPMLVRPFVDRLIAFGVLPAPAEENGYSVNWPDLNAPSDKDKAEVAKATAEAMAKYIGGNVDAIIPPEEWLGMVMKMDPEEIKQIVSAADKYVSALEDEEEEEEKTEEKKSAKSDTEV